MPRSPLADALAHHCWATARLIDACLPLTPEQLATDVPGTYGSILATMRHLVGADRSYLWLLGEGMLERVDEDVLDLTSMRSVIEANAQAWDSLVSNDLDPDEVVVRRRDDGSETHAPRGIRLAQVIHHGTDHRSQVCTGLTSLGVEPPEIDVWAFAEQDGRMREVFPTS